MPSFIAIIIVWVSSLSLLGMGLIMVAGTGPWARESVSTYAFFQGQLQSAGIGLLCAVIISFIDYRRIKPYVWYIFGGACLLLLLCYVPGIGLELNGSKRWVNLLFARFQPSECAKICVILALAYWYSKNKDGTKTFIKGGLIPGAIIGFPVALIFFEKDMGTAAVLGIAAASVMFLMGLRWIYIIAGGLGGLCAFSAYVYLDENRWRRVQAFFDKGNEEFDKAQAYQQNRAEIAFQNGGLEGVGIGEGIEKHGYLPYAHTDFIFASIGEEFGFYGSIGVVIAFFLLTLAGLYIALQTKDVFGRALAAGAILIVFFPAALNMGVVTGCFPNSGLPLPFISYGGTNLIFTLMAIGVLTSVQRHTIVKKKSKEKEIEEKLADRKRNLRL